MTSRAVVPLLALALPACPSSPATTNPPALWLAPDGVETKVRLIDHEPTPF
jgi:hypothetical protein